MGDMDMYGLPRSPGDFNPDEEYELEEQVLREAEEPPPPPPPEDVDVLEEHVYTEEGDDLLRGDHTLDFTGRWQDHRLAYRAPNDPKTAFLRGAFDAQKAANQKTHQVKHSVKVTSILSKNSYVLSTIPYMGYAHDGDGVNYASTPQFNMDIYRQSLALDTNPLSGESQYYKIINDPNDKYFDGSAKVFDNKILTLIDSFSREDAIETEATIGLATAGLQALKAAFSENNMESEDSEAPTSRRLLRVPMMQRQTLVDSRYDIPDQIEDEAGKDRPFITEQRALHVPTSNGKAVYKPNSNTASVLLNSELKVSCIFEHDNKNHVAAMAIGYNSDSQPIYSLDVYAISDSSSMSTDNIALRNIPAPPDYVRRLLCLWEWDEEILADARRRWARSYLQPWQPAMIAVNVGSYFSTFELSTSLLLNQAGGKLCYDPTSKSFWAWDMENLWHANPDAWRTTVKTAGTELSENAVVLLNRRLYINALDEAYRKYGYLMGGSQGSRGVGDRGSDDEDDGVNEDEERAAAKVESCIRKLPLSTSLSTHSRMLDAKIESMKDFVCEAGFEASFSTHHATAFSNGIQDLFPPYAFHEPTPLDRVCGRLPYSLDPPPANQQEFNELQEWVIERYGTFGFDRETSLREADKDAVMLTGNPAIVSQANIRLHLGPYDPENEAYGSRSGKNLRMAMLKSVYGDKLNTKLNASHLSMKMEAGKAYSIFDGVEHSLGLWIDEAQNKKNGDQSKVETWNEGFVLKIATGSKASQFTYRVEHGKEKTVTLKVQAINVSSNKINLPDNPGIRSKTEVSPYPKLGFNTDEEVAASIARGQPAFKIDPKMLNAVTEHPGKLARYYVERDKRILEDPDAVYPRSQAIKDATERVLQQSTETTSTRSSEDVEMALEQFLSDHVKPCMPKGLSAYDETLNYGEQRKKFQHQRPRCFCGKKTNATACSFCMKDLAALLKEHVDHSTYKYFMPHGDKKITKLTSAVQSLLGLEQARIEQVNGVERSTLFGFTLHENPIDSTASHEDREERRRQIRAEESGTDPNASVPLEEVPYAAGNIAIPPGGENPTSNVDQMLQVSESLMQPGGQLALEEAVTGGNGTGSESESELGDSDDGGDDSEDDDESEEESESDDESLDSATSSDDDDDLEPKRKRKSTAKEPTAKKKKA